MNHIALSSILHIFPSQALLLLEIFLKIFHQGQYGLIRIIPSVKSHKVRSMFSFATFLANSDQEITRAIRFDPYPPYKGFTKCHQRLILYSISSAVKKLNQKQHNLTHIVLNVVIVFRSAWHFPIFIAKFD